MSISAVIFDLDGTLADTITDIGNAVNYTLRRHGFPSHPIETYKLMVGNGFPTLMQRAVPESAVNDSPLFTQLVSEAAERYRVMSLDTTVPFAGVSDLLATLTAQGVKLAVLSNKPDELTKMLIPALFPGIPFVAIEGDLPGRRRKPDPERALEILAMAGLTPEQTAFVGDSGVDMETGVNGNMTPLGAAWGYRTLEELQKHGARAILKKPADLLNFVGPIEQN